MNDYLIQRLSVLCSEAKEQARANPSSVQDRFRVKGYTDAMERLKGRTIVCEADIPLNPKSKIYAKVVAFMKEYSSVPNVPNVPSVPNVPCASPAPPYELLKGITGIGEAKARILVDTHGIRTVEELRTRPELLNDKQRIGLRHYEHERIRIPRSEIESYLSLFNDILHDIGTAWNMSINGSFRRGASDSGDIDCLISSELHDYYVKFIESLQNKQYIRTEDTLAYGDKKYMGYIYRDGSTPRRIDIIYCPPAEFAFAQLYFTGSGSFNIRMREHAKKLGYRLNEKGLVSLKNESIEASFATETDIFRFLGIPYVEPWERN